AFQAAQVVSTAARSGALYASGSADRDPDVATPADAGRQAAVAEGASLDPPLRAEDVAVTTGPGGVTVTVTYRFKMLTGYAGFADGLTIARTVTMSVAPKTPGAR